MADSSRRYDVIVIGSGLELGSYPVAEADGAISVAI
ncbi:hypothetical protein M2432_000213 [Mycobacterium sp. OTB74]|nr:hypothetical protein [Mycobacterium sp. OTB74]